MRYRLSQASVLPTQQKVKVQEEALFTDVAECDICGLNRLHT